MDRMDRCREEIKANIDYDFLLQEHSADLDIIDGYVELMVEACCTSKDFLIIGGEKLPSGLVKAQFFKLTQEHITYVLDCMKSNTTLIGNISFPVAGLVSTCSSSQGCLIKGFCFSCSGFRSLKARVIFSYLLY